MKRLPVSELESYIIVTKPVLRIKEIITHINQLEKVGYDYDVIYTSAFSQIKDKIVPHFVLIRKVISGDPMEIIMGDNKRRTSFNYYNRYFKAGTPVPKPSGSPYE